MKAHEKKLGRAFSAKTMKLHHLGFRFAPPQVMMGSRYAASEPPQHDLKLCPNPVRLITKLSNDLEEYGPGGAPRLRDRSAEAGNR
jgi:hypothetical protein